MVPPLLFFILWISSSFGERCSEVTMVHPWSRGYTGLLNIQAEQMITTWNLTMVFSEGIESFKTWKGNVIEDGNSFNITNKCYNGILYTSQCLSIDYIVRHNYKDPSTVTDIYFNDEILPRCTKSLECEKANSSETTICGSCSKCPSPGVEGGYETYNHASEQFNQLWGNVTSLDSQVKDNGLSIGKKCSEGKCQEIEGNATKLQEELDQLKTINITDLEAKVATMMDEISSLKTRVAANEAAVGNKCEASKCTSLQTNLGQVETCLGDVSSADCPTSSLGKTGVVASITALTQSLNDKCDATKCTSVETKIGTVETCFADKSSSTCPSATTGKVSITDAITALEMPTIFNCAFMSGDIATSTAKLSPYTCDVNEGNVVDASSGVFTVPKAGKYRLTFMVLNIPLNQKKVICILMKTSSGVESKIARSVAQTKVGNNEEQITTTIDIIHELQKDETVHVEITVTMNAKIVGTDSSKPQQVTFTGEFIRS